MKRWLFALSALAVLGSSIALEPLQAFSQEQPRNKIFLFSDDYPSDILFEHPQPPVKETRFWQYLDRAMRERSSMALTENLEEANYRVELRCSGITWCGKVKVYLMSPHRDVLASYSLPGKAMFFPSNLKLMAKRLTETLDYRISAIEEGGVGNYGMTRYRYRYTGGPRASKNKAGKAAGGAAPVNKKSEF